MDASTSTAPGKTTMQCDGGIARITLSNPARYNAMSLSMWRDLKTLVDQASQAEEVRAVLLTGEGDKAFVSGADISEFGHLRNDPAQVAAYGEAVQQAQQALAQCAKPVVAGIRGVCMGGGIGLALACDLRYCSHDSRFRMPAARLGLGYDLDSMRQAVAALGMARTAELFMTARNFDGHEAERTGMVHRSYPPDRFEQELRNILDAVAGNAPLTLRAAKLALRHLSRPDDVTENQVTQAIQDCFSSADYQEGQRAFREKRQPLFKGV